VDPGEIDRLVRGEVWKVFHGRRSRQPRISRFADVERVEEPEDQSARNFERALETADEVRACLECLPEDVRQLVIEAYTLTEGELSGSGIRERLAKNLGISRNAVDQRLSRAIKSIRERMRGGPGSETT
jgi:RNA polymerase sigma factor (sigma-70 family)